MFDWLDKIRKEPASKRRLISFGISLFFTGIIFVVWLTVWFPGIARKTEIVKKEDSFSTPKDNFFKSASDAWQGITDQYSRLKNVLGGIDVANNLTSSVNYHSATTTDEISIIEVSTTTSSSTKSR